MADESDRAHTVTALDVRPVRFKTAERSSTGPAAAVEWFVWLRYYNELGALALWDVALWDTPEAVWAGEAEPHDIGCDVISLHTGIGRDEPLARFRPGSATVTVDDPDGNLSPWSTAGNTDAYAAVRPGIGLFIEARYIPTDTRYPVFTGTVTAITETFPGITGHTVTFVAVDALGELGAFDGIEQTPVGANELAGARIERIVRMVGLDVQRILDSGSIPLQATTLAQNALNEAGLVCDTELGALWVRGDGVLRFLDRLGLQNDPHYTEPQYVFGESEPELCYADIALATDADAVRNVVSISNAGGTAVTHTDPTSISLYGQRTYQRMDLIHVDGAQSALIADRYLAFFGDASRRIDELVLLPSVTPAVIVAALTLEVLWRIQVRRRAVGFQVVADLQVQSIEHEITATEWKTTLKTFSAASVHAPGRWDIDRWDTATAVWGW